MVNTEEDKNLVEETSNNNSFENEVTEEIDEHETSDSER